MATQEATRVKFPQREASITSSLVRFAKRKPLGTIGAAVILLVILLAAFGNLVMPHDPYESFRTNVLQPPSLNFVFGTDELGRDIVSRVISGAKISVFVSFSAVLLGTLVGSLIGTVSAYFGSWVDIVVQRIMDAAQAVPPLVMALTIVALLDPSILNVTWALAFSLIPRSSRVVRGAVIGVMENQYMEAARAVGCPDWRILARYVLPNIMAPIIVIASVTLGAAIIAESSLSFLGLGAPPPTISWGSMLSGSGRIWMEDAPWMALAPGVAIMVTVMAFNFLGDALRDVLDPRLRS